jgi:hypothetical protein
MNFEYQSLLPAEFDPESRVWIYQANRLLTLSEALGVEDRLNAFVSHWQSHGDPVKGYANLFFGQFIMLMADEKATGVSGCSTDSSVRLIKQLEKEFNIQLFDRQLLAFIKNDKIQLIPISQLEYAFTNQFIHAETLYFNNTVLNKADLSSKWILPLKDSWLSSRLKIQVQY